MYTQPTTIQNPLVSNGGACHTNLLQVHKQNIKTLIEKLEKKGFDRTAILNKIPKYNPESTLGDLDSIVESAGWLRDGISQRSSKDIIALLDFIKDTTITSDDGILGLVTEYCDAFANNPQLLGSCCGYRTHQESSSVYASLLQLKNVLSSSNEIQAECNIEQGDVALELSAQKIMAKGENISSHYLSQQSAYSIWRYEGAVYTVKKDDSSYVKNWDSHKGQEAQSLQQLGKGVYGTVYKKTDDKAIKKFTIPEWNKKQECERKNERLLQFKFFLKEHKLEDRFITGLWNTKDNNAATFIMPLVDKSDSPKNEANWDNLALALKSMNEGGYYHMDIANSINHLSLQNVMADGVSGKNVLIDMDNVGIIKEDPIKADQWLFLLNTSNPTLREYYQSNPESPLSDNLPKLKELYIVASKTDNPIRIPNEVLTSMGLEVNNLQYGDELSNENITVFASEIFEQK